MDYYLNELNDFTPAIEFFNKNFDKVYLLLRHGERAHITPQDADFGAHVGLTENGCAQAKAFGKIIKPKDSFSLFSSPVGRCVQTAKFIGQGIGACNPQVKILNCLGNYFVKDQKSYEQLLQSGFYESIFEWLQKKLHLDAFFSLPERCSQMLEMLQSLGNEKVNIFITHDAWIVPCLSYFCNMHFTPKHWMNFLSGLAVTKIKDNITFTPITAIKSGWLYF